MPVPILIDDLFELSDDIFPYVEDDVIIIDNVYKNHEQIVSILETMPAANWKITEETRNFKDYYDCRPVLTNWGGKNTDKLFQLIADLARSAYGIEGISCANPGHRLFNAFKFINVPDTDRDLQFFPHFDTKIATITTFDSICSGGTALYDMDPLGEELYQKDGLRSQNFLYDVTDIPKKVIPSETNRMIIFKGTQWHGGYVEDYSKYVDNWRLNEVFFFN